MGGDAGFPRPNAQIRVYDDHGRQVYRLDLGYVGRLIGLEYDGLEFHDSDDSATTTSGAAATSNREI